MNTSMSIGTLINQTGASAPITGEYDVLRYI